LLRADRHCGLCLDMWFDAFPREGVNTAPTD
jgi:hypothetical protein